jgi:hypothetical protein
MWSKFCDRFYEVVVELPSHKAKTLNTNLRMHSTMVLKKSNDSLHLRLGKDAMMSPQMLSAPSKANPLQKTQVVPEFYS